MSQEQVVDTSNNEQEPEVTQETAQKVGEQALDTVFDDFLNMLDEIDEVLEENAEEFVQGFKQTGGQ